MRGALLFGLGVMFGVLVPFGAMMAQSIDTDAVIRAQAIEIARLHVESDTLRTLAEAAWVGQPLAELEAIVPGLLERSTADTLFLSGDVQVQGTTGAVHLITNHCAVTGTACEPTGGL